jgi:hypothetical protein
LPNALSNHREPTGRYIETLDQATADEIVARVVSAIDPEV